MDAVRALGFGQVVNELQRSCERRIGLPMSVAAPHDFRRLSQVVDSARPVGAPLEVVCQLGRDVLHPPRVHRCEPLANPTMPFRSAYPRLPVIENLPVHYMHKFVALGHAAVGTRLSARPFGDVMPARQLLACSMRRQWQ